MVLLLVGAFVALLGLFCGIVLTLAPLGVVKWSADMVLWVLFPILSIVGFVVFATAGKTAQVRSFMFAASCLLLLLALASVTSIVLAAASVFKPAGSLLSLWYVLAVAGVIGAVGVAASKPVATDD